MTRTQAGAASFGAMLCLSGAAAAQTANTPTPVPPATAPASSAPAAPATVTLPVPGMAGSLAFSAPPYSVDTGPFGKIYVDGVLSGLGLAQSDPTQIDRSTFIDLSNAQVFVQKIDGFVQFYAQIGAYSIPALGSPYSFADVSHAIHNFYTFVPQVFLKLAPTDNFSVEIGKLPTLIGAEYTFDFENFNIDRGLLWNQEPAVSQGVQVNYTRGPVTFSLSLNDGYYSDRFNWLSGSATWTINPTNTLVFAAGGNLGSSATSTTSTPLFQNNSSIYNLIYTYNNAPLTITPYLQFSHVDTNPNVGIYNAANTYSGAVIANYVFTPKFQLAGRVEYIKTDGGNSEISPTNLLYGAGSGAFSFTATPTFTYKHYFVRADLSVVDITSLTRGDGFGHNGDSSTQFRGILETGVIF